MIEFVREPIDLNRVSTFCSMDRVGAVSLFVGITRRFTGNIETLCLEYEAYESMATMKMLELTTRVAQQWQIERVAFVHRLGRVAIGETSMVVAVGSAHRDNAIDACHWIVERVKAEVPIWKKEHYAEGDPKWIHPVKSYPVQNK
ncbi:MAG: molybdenum cofactor biosynthesis protein MoaE [Planctomycetaceae bacterium]|jgi:molybdopterin synthase catalytic subunit|nr:molybdenum cofactor biosynthesis protein MoaE [Planctomycetaceae bacterium]